MKLVGISYFLLIFLCKVIVIVIFDFVMVFIGELISGVLRVIFLVSVEVRLMMFVCEVDVVR